MNSKPTLLLALALAASPALAQDAASRASTASMAALSALPSASLELVAAGGAFSVAAIRPLGDGIEVVLRSAESSAEVVVLVAAETAQAASIGVGAAVSVSATAAGFLIVSAGTAIAFIPDAIVAGMIHHEAIRP